MAVAEKKGTGPAPRNLSHVDPWFYTVNRALATLVPIELGYLVSTPITDLFWALWRRKRETTKRNYARLLHRSPDDPLVSRLARDSFRHFGRYIVELLHVQSWSIDRLQESLDLVGEEHFDEAKAHGRGVIFTSAHMGSIEVASSLLLLKRYRITSVAEWLRPKLLMDWIVTCRQKVGVTLLPAQGTGMKLVRALRRNEMVALVVDVGVGNGIGVPVQFFGHRTYFPVGPARLARMSGAPIIFGLAVRQPGNRFAAYFSPPIFADPELDADEDARVTTQRVAEQLERFVKRYPSQWYAFRDMFPDDGWPLA
ncbi:MAG: lysophospholipid acyltransferase family protein, partial [Dehalococcoidia bacterium]